MFFAAVQGWPVYCDELFFLGFTWLMLLSAISKLENKQIQYLIFWHGCCTLTHSRNFISRRQIKVWWVSSIMWNLALTWCEWHIILKHFKLHSALFLGLLCNLCNNLLVRKLPRQNGRSWPEVWAEVFSFIYMISQLFWNKIEHYFPTFANTSAKCLQFWNSWRVDCHNQFLFGLIIDNIRRNLPNLNEAEVLGSIEK